LASVFGNDPVKKMMMMMMKTDDVPPLQPQPTLTTSLY
jgi:hypothetical protein